MRESTTPLEAALADPLEVALAQAGGTGALVRVLRLLVKRGVLSEAELLEELKKP
jgi:hypothetical protein